MEKIIKKWIKNLTLIENNTKWLKKTQKPKKGQKGKDLTFGVGAPSSKLQPTYGKEGKGSMISTKETKAQQCKKK